MMIFKKNAEVDLETPFLKVSSVELPSPSKKSINGVDWPSLHRHLSPLDGPNAIIWVCLSLSLSSSTSNLPAPKNKPINDYLRTTIEEAYAFISPHNPSTTLSSFLDLYQTLSTSIINPVSPDVVKFHPNPHSTNTDDRTAVIENDPDSGSHIKIIYDCDTIILPSSSYNSIRLVPSTTASLLTFVPYSSSLPKIPVPSVDSNYKVSMSLYATRRYGEIEMERKNWMQALNWFRRGEYNAILKRSDDNEIRPGVDKHAQAQCLRMMGEHGLARKCWEDGRRKYPEEEFIAREMERIMRYERRGGGGLSFECTSIRSNYVYISTSPVLSLTQCTSIINATEHHCSTNGWTTTRHYDVPTTDVPVYEVKEVLDLFNDTIYQTLESFVSTCFGVSSLFIHDAFVVKYDARVSPSSSSKAAAVSLPWHFDESTFSFTLALNDEFKGGGTEFSIGGVVSPEVGGIVGFRGDKCWHCGKKIDEGVRYVLVVFCFGGGEGGRIKEVLKWVRGDCGEEEEEEDKVEESNEDGGFSFGFDVT